MKSFDPEQAKELIYDLKHTYGGPRDQALAAAKLFRTIDTHYKDQILALEARVQVLEQDIIYAELLKIRNLSERILTVVQPPQEGTDQSQGETK